jgi:hypothetical protein
MGKHRTGGAPAAGLESQDLRVSDSERERVVDELREHGATGRLDVDELADRVEHAYRARTRADLAVPLADLPDVRRRRARRAAAVAGLRHHFTAFAAVNLLLIGVWGATGGCFWPVWPLMGWGIGVAMHARPILLRRVRTG